MECCTIVLENTIFLFFQLWKDEVTEHCHKCTTAPHAVYMSHCLWYIGVTQHMSKLSVCYCSQSLSGTNVQRLFRQNHDWELPSDKSIKKWHGKLKFKDMGGVLPTKQFGQPCMSEEEGHLIAKSCFIHEPWVW